MAAADGGWTSVEVAKLVVGVLTPLTVVALGVVVARGTRRVEAVQEANKAVITRRLAVFDLVATKLNQLLCFATFVGRWKEISPDQALQLKRGVDEVMFANKPLFSDALFTAYQGFMACLFEMNSGANQDARIRALITSAKGDRRALAWWRADPDDDQQARFTTGEVTSPAEAWAAYQRLSQAFRADLYITDTTRPLPAPAGT